jgi:NADH-quinone oxidoreductase subunit J
MQIAFYGLSAVVLVAALAVVTRRNVAHAAFALLPCFLGLAGLYAALDADFFFVIQVLVYAGAILVLFVFALMLTRDVVNPTTPQMNRLTGYAVPMALVLLLVTSALLLMHNWRTTADAPAEAGRQAADLGVALIGPYAVPFEAASLILLAALVGAVVLAKTEREPEPEPPALAPIPEEGP